VLISTLSKYISAMGGSLKLIAEFPHGASVEVQGMAVTLDLIKMIIENSLHLVGRVKLMTILETSYPL
jgi:hypothetical protein